MATLRLVISTEIDLLSFTEKWSDYIESITVSTARKVGHCGVIEIFFSSDSILHI